MSKWYGKRNIGQTLCAPASILPLNRCVLLGKHPNLSKLSSLLNFANLVCVCVRAARVCTCKRAQSPSCVQLFATPWIVARQAPLSLGFSRQERSGVPLPSPNMLSRLVITFLPRSKHLLISLLQSPSAMILEPRKIKSTTGTSIYFGENWLREIN